MTENDSFYRDHQDQIMRLQEDRDYWKNLAFTLQDLVDTLKTASYNSVLDLTDALMNVDNDLFRSTNNYIAN